jgi:predicted YcjX-like family ATPase
MGAKMGLSLADPDFRDGGFTRETGLSLPAVHPDLKFSRLEYTVHLGAFSSDRRTWASTGRDMSTCRLCAEENHQKALVV